VACRTRWRAELGGEPAFGVAALEASRGEPVWRLRQSGSLTRVRLTEFWTKMRAQFGEAYADSVARDHALPTLGSRTVNQALADGEDAKTVWRAVCEAFHIPERRR
jgi:Protein of unknown function (DUF3046)